jgi:hypothetical protein
MPGLLLLCFVDRLGWPVASLALLFLCLLTFITAGSVSDGSQYLRDASAANVTHGVTLGRLASAAFTEAFGSINPEHWSAERTRSLEERFLQCGKLFLELNQVDDAADAFETAIRFKETTVLRQSLGDVRLKQWLLSAASDNYERALELGMPEEASLYKSMAVVAMVNTNLSGTVHWLKLAKQFPNKQTRLRELTTSHYLVTGTVQAMAPVLIKGVVQDFDIHKKIGTDLFWMGAYSSSQVHIQYRVRSVYEQLTSVFNRPISSSLPR